MIISKLRRLYVYFQAYEVIWFPSLGGYMLENTEAIIFIDTEAIICFILLHQRYNFFRLFL